MTLNDETLPVWHEETRSPMRLPSAAANLGESGSRRSSKALTSPQPMKSIAKYPGWSWLVLFATSPTPSLQFFQPSPLNKLACSSQSYAEMCDSSKQGPIHAKDSDPSINALECLRRREETLLCFPYDSQAPKQAQ